MSVQTQSMHKSLSIAKFQINSRRGSLVYVIFQPCVLNFREDGEWLIFRFLNGFLSLLFCTNRAQSLYLVTVFPSSVHQFFLTILLLFHRSFHVFLTKAICIYLCFAGEVLFRFLLLVSSVIRLEYQTRQASCVKGW